MPRQAIDCGHGSAESVRVYHTGEGDCLACRAVSLGLDNPPWAIEAGRGLQYNGVTVANLHRATRPNDTHGPLTAADADALARRIVGLLNDAKVNPNGLWKEDCP